MTPPNDPPAPANDHFLTTRWSLVLHAGRASSPQAERALESLCSIYWYPLYAFIRRRGHSREDAEDLTQGFFASFLRTTPLEGLAAERGKFRAFLLAALKNYLANEYDKGRRLKRGGGVVHLSLDWQGADDRFHLDQPHATNPDHAFDREWAIAVLERVLDRLREEAVTAGKTEIFDHLRGFLSLGEPISSYAEVARTLAMDEGAVRVAVHRLRQRYRSLLRDEITQTLVDPALVAEELRSLQAALIS